MTSSDPAQRGHRARPATSLRSRTGARRRGPRAHQVLAIALGIGVGVLGATGAAGVSYAFLNDSADLGAAGTVSAGTSGLEVQYNGGTPASSVTIPASVFQNMLPGDVRRVDMNVVNVGIVPQTVAARVSATSAWETRVAEGACTGSAVSGPALTTSPTGSMPLAVGASKNVCVQLTLPANAHKDTEGTSANFSLILDGTQSPVAP